MTGKVEATCTHPAILTLCRRASDLALPMLGHVDEYDDTVFNRAQMRAVTPELTALADESSLNLAEAASDLLSLAAQVERRPHRYLVFNGD